MGLKLFCNGKTVLEYETTPNHERIFSDLKFGSYQCSGQKVSDDEESIEFTDTLYLTRQDIDSLRFYLAGNNFNELKFEWEYSKKKLRERVPSARQTVEDLLLEITPIVLETQYDYKFLETISLILSFADTFPDQMEFTFTCKRPDIQDVENKKKEQLIQENQVSVHDSTTSPSSPTTGESE